MSAASTKKATAFPNGKPFVKINTPPYRVETKADIFKNAKAKITPDGMVRVTCFTRSVYKSEDWILTDSSKYTSDLLGADKCPREIPTAESETVRERSDSLKRAKDKIFEISACNDWDYMVTFTLDKEKIDRYNPKEIIKPFGKWLDNMVQRRGLKALIIPEYHKDGAIHFHGLINNSLKMTESGTYKVKGRKSPIKLSTLKKQGKTPTDDDVQTVFNVTDYKLGHSTAIQLDGNVTAVAFYMTKYATKELDKIFGSYYFAVGKINRHLPFVICNMDFNELASCGKVFDLPNNLGKVCYATITTDDFFYGSEVL